MQLRIRSYSASAVSYTHLDVYKRQLQGRATQYGSIKTVQAVCNDYESNFSGLVGVELLPQCFKQLVHTDVYKRQTDTELLASSPRKLFVERTEAYNAEVKRTIAESGKAKH